MGIIKETAKRTHFAGDSGKETAPFTGRTMKTVWSAGILQRRPTTIASVLSHLKKGEIWLFCQIVHFVRESVEAGLVNSTDPCETSWLMLVCPKETWWTKTTRNLSDKDELTQPRALPVIPMTCSRLCSRMLRSAESKAALRSRTTTAGQVLII